MRLLWIPTVVLLALAGCAEKEPAEKADGVIPQHQLDAMEKARNTEQLLQDAADRREETTEQ